MASADQLKALVKSHISRDDTQFYSVAMQVAAHEAKAGHGKLAEELRDMIDAAKTRSISSAPGKLVPLARPRGELANLLDVSYPKNRLADMVLDPVVLEQLQRIMKERRLHARIREHGLSPRRKLLLVGPPGTGKTMTASVLAGALSTSNSRGSVGLTMIPASSCSSLTAAACQDSPCSMKPPGRAS